MKNLEDVIVNNTQMISDSRLPCIFRQKNGEYNVNDRVSSLQSNPNTTNNVTQSSLLSYFSRRTSLEKMMKNKVKMKGEVWKTKFPVHDNTLRCSSMNNDSTIVTRSNSRIPMMTMKDSKLQRKSSFLIESIPTWEYVPIQHSNSFPPSGLRTSTTNTCS
jgi:hypothetical protein